MLLGIVVTAAHTAGVYLLGFVTLYASRYIVPEQLYPWLGAISGLSVTGLGIFIFLRHWTGESGEHSHAPGDQHSHWFPSLFKAGRSSKPRLGNRSLTFIPSQNQTRGVSLRELCLLGITGGIVPCPAALVVLLSAFSLHRIGFGLFLITAFSLGLAAVLVMVGLTMVYTKRFMASRVGAERSWVRYLPLAVLGVYGGAGAWHCGFCLSVGTRSDRVFSPETNWSRLSRSRSWACFSECAIPPIPITWWPCLPL